MLVSHYAPHKLILREAGQPWPEGADWGYCAFSQKISRQPPHQLGSTQRQRQLRGAAMGLFAALRRLDASPAQRLCAS